MVQVTDLVLCYCCEHCFSSEVVFFVICALLYTLLPKSNRKKLGDFYTTVYMHVSRSVLVYDDFSRSDNTTGAKTLDVYDIIIQKLQHNS